MRSRQAQQSTVETASFECDAVRGRRAQTDRACKRPVCDLHINFFLLFTMMSVRMAVRMEELVACCDVGDFHGKMMKY